MKIYLPLSRLFETHDYKRLILMGLLLSTAFLFAGFGVIALEMGHIDIFVTKSVLSVLLLLLLYFYRRSHNTSLFALLFLMLVEFESVSAMFGGHFYDFVTIFPFFSVLAFFYFFRLKNALLLTALHFTVWSALAVILYNENAANPVFHHVPMINMLSTTFVVVFIGIIYHLSTERTYAELERADRQKALFLKEVYHRTKNNLNQIASLLGLQLLRLKNGEAESAEALLKKNKLRIEAMAMVHEALYRSNDLSKIDAAEYMRHLTEQVCRAFGIEAMPKVETDGTALPFDKMLKIGMVLNELCTNTIKHAPHGGDLSSIVRIALTCDRGKCRFHYEQKALHDTAKPLKLEREDGLGMTLIRLNVEEMDGTLQIEHQNKRLAFTILFQPFISAGT